MTQKPHCIVFDFDGVLIDSNHIKREAYFQVFRHLPGSTGIVEQCLREHAHGDRREVITAIIEKIESAEIRRPALLSQYVEAYAQVCDEQIPRCAEQPGASAMLPLLAAGFPLFINSATPRQPLERYVALRGWTHHFKGVYGRPASKVANFETIARQEQLRADTMLFIGDSALDAQAARLFGCAFLGFRSRGGDLPDDPSILRALEELPPRLHLAESHR